MFDSKAAAIAETQAPARKRGTGYAAALASIPAPAVVPVTIEQEDAPRKPKAAPCKQVACERIRDGAGNTVGLEMIAKPGHGLVRVVLSEPDSKGRFKVSIFTKPRRGRAFKRGA